jgi:hypothetical protein
MQQQQRERLTPLLRGFIIADAALVGVGRVKRWRQLLNFGRPARGVTAS